MSNQEVSNEEQKTRTAAGVFVAFLTLAGGFAGMLIAALAVGAERGFSGDNGSGADRAERQQQRLDRHLAWLAGHSAVARRRREALQEWMTAGSIPEDRPARPNLGERVGTGAHLLWSKFRVWSIRTLRGLRDGWSAAGEVRRNGGNPIQVLKARPGPVCPICKVNPTQVEGQACPTCTNAAILNQAVQPQLQPQAVPQQQPQQPATGTPTAEDPTAVLARLADEVRRLNENISANNANRNG